MRKKTFVTIVVILIIAVGLIFAGSNRTGEYDTLASCIAESGAIFYGTFWCPQCQEQKRIFGASERLLPYEECSTPDGKGQRLACRDAQVSVYPTWVFADGARVEGRLGIAELTERTNCSLPESTDTQ